MDPEGQKQQISFVVPRHLVKQIKTGLETQSRSHATAKIRPISALDNGALATTRQGGFLVPTAFGSKICTGQSGHDEASQFLRAQDCADTVEIIVISDLSIPSPVANSGLEIAVRDWYGKLITKKNSVSPSAPSLPHYTTDVEALVRELPKTYSIYGPLLLLPQHAFQMESWSNLLVNLDPDEIGNIFHAICDHLRVSHIATNAPIPLNNITGKGHAEDDSNILRSPTNLHPLHGDFGPICTKAQPSAEDFEDAFWASTKQNGIMQFWAPRYTMFSRGNITEKARVLHMPSVKTAMAQSPQTGCSAVDLYAGIGYFTFSYAAAGVQKVLCWDLNPWSIEGLRRGAVSNKWETQVYYGDEVPSEGAGIKVSAKTRLIAFVESNEKALARIEAMREALPPIRHVNCGLLPTSRGSYTTAAAALDPRLGGWVHVHENFGAQEVTCKADEVRAEFERLIASLDEERDFMQEQASKPRTVAMEHIQRVKSYAPGVFHCVVDIFIPPISI